MNEIKLLTRTRKVNLVMLYRKWKFMKNLSTLNLKYYFPITWKIQLLFTQFKEFKYLILYPIGGLTH